MIGRWVRRLRSWLCRDVVIIHHHHAAMRDGAAFEDAVVRALEDARRRGRIG